ncbi:MAG: hypothetical protein LBE92_02595 [Chryseobacterium sp.]|jgi:tetratricopeptide (TPR) repeat protein|uniref:tetratricopeptide repeat protein n=1 Tax=Chryseobacterium sp. TaxID=1871047 RepID=UPI002828039F|nr:hypothetical protein [Chryseobacterium sp.]MDR2234989.1 hypothetical protein [Chryseobacterium sp.]
MMRCFPFILFFILISCQHPSQKEYEESFDIPLITKNKQYFLAGEYDSLVSLNRIYLKQADKTDYKGGKALCYINLANLNKAMENYSQAQYFFDQAADILNKSENNLHKAKLYESFSTFSWKLSRLNKAIEYNNLALHYIQNAENSPLKNDILFNIYVNQAYNHMGRKQFKMASNDLYKAKVFDTDGKIDCLMGDFYLYAIRNKDSAYIYSSRIYEKVNKEKRMDKVSLYANTIMGEYYLQQKNYDEAEKVLLKALKVDIKTRRIFIYYTKYLYNNLRGVYNSKGNNKKAYFYLKAYIKAKNETNSLMLSALNRDMKRFMMKTEEDAQRDKNKIFLLVLIGAVIFTFSGIYSWQAIDGLRQKKIKLKNETEELIGEMDNTVKEKAIELAKNNDPSFLQVFREAYPGFIEKLLTIDPDPEDSELVFCAMLKLHFSSKEIAGFTSIQHRTVQQKKYRTRKRLNIPQDMDIYLFFDQLL